MIMTMKYQIVIALMLVAQYLVGCASCAKQEEEAVVETFSESTPYTIEVKKERSYFLAEKIAKRLTKMGLGGYVIPEETGNGTWYKIVSGALADSAAVEAYKAKLDTCFNIKDVAVVDYAKLDSVARRPVVKDSIKEMHRISANRPDVPRSIMEVAGKFPDNDMFYLSSIGILTLDKDGIKGSKGETIDMPRGISLSYLQSKGGQSFASVIYKDNIYGDNVTLQVVKLKDTTHVMKASLMPSFTAQNESSVYLCSEIADRVLDTGEYDDETKAPFERQAYQKLSGFVASFLNKGTKRSYYIFTDEAGEYIYMAQSTKNKDEEMFEFIGEIGKSEGLVMYDEFYNSFYTAPDRMEEEDVFVGYYMDKLTWGYAKSKGYQTWAKRMVGHWKTSLVFVNKEKGMWMYELFDLLSDTKGQQIYKVLYRGNLNRNCYRIIYGVPGASVSSWDYSEVNFGYGRYVVGLSNLGSYSERDMIKRAEILQFERGGYSDGSTTKEASAKSL